MLQLQQHPSRFVRPSQGFCGCPTIKKNSYNKMHLGKLLHYRQILNLLKNTLKIDRIIHIYVSERSFETNDFEI